MKKIITITAATALSFGGFALTAFADEERYVQERVEQRTRQTVYEQRGQRPDHDDQEYERRGLRPDADDHQEYERRGLRRGADDHQGFERRGDGLGQLRREVNHLNRMIDHVRGEMRAYGAGRRIRAQYEHIRAEGYRLNNQFRRGEQYYDRRRVRAQIEHMRAELRQIERNLHVRANNLYQWR